MTDTIMETSEEAIGKLQAEIARLREQAEALADALAAVRTQLVDSAYGPFPGGDPRLFTPDYDDNTPEEIGAWKAACEEWERGIGEDRGPSCLTFGDGTAYTGGGFGMGVSQWKHEAVEIIIDPALRTYREANQPEGDDEYGMVKDAEQVADHLPPGWKL